MGFLAALYGIAEFNGKRNFWCDLWLKYEALMRPL